MKIRFIFDGFRYSPKIEFISEWAAWLYLKSVFSDEQLKHYRQMQVIK